ncbi:hypothetical protein CHUAL_002304 [Chamberlinius hualienensis]
MANLVAMWSHYETSVLNVNLGIIYYKVVCVDEKLYLFGLDSRSGYLKMAKINLTNMLCTEFKTIIAVNLIRLKINAHIHGYGEHFLILIVDLKTLPVFKLQKIHPITCQLEEFQFELDEVDYIEHIGECVAKDKMYIFLDKMGVKFICVINLKTFHWELIVGQNSLQDYRLGSLSAVAYGGDIYCFNRFKPGQFVFNTAKKLLKKLENYEDNDADSKGKVIGNVIVCDELFVFKKIVNLNGLNQSRTEIFNLKIKKWRKASFSFPFFIDDSFVGCCVVNNMIIAFNNAAKTLKSVRDERHNLTVGDDHIKIHILDLKPSFRQPINENLQR